MEFEESEHPRGFGGRFGDKGGVGGHHPYGARGRVKTSGVVSTDIILASANSSLAKSNGATVGQFIASHDGDRNGALIDLKKSYEAGEVEFREPDQGAPERPAKTSSSSLNLLGLDDANLEMRKAVLEKGKKDGKEWIGIVDSKSGKVYLPSSDGKKDAVRIPDAAMSDILSGGVDFTLHHNHPASSSLSLPDLAIAKRWNIKILAHAHNGAIFSARVRKMPGQDIGEVHRQVENAIVAESKRIPKRDRLLQELVVSRHSHLANLALSKLGHIDYEFSFGDDPSYAKVAQSFDDLAERISKKVNK